MDRDKSGGSKKPEQSDRDDCSEKRDSNDIDFSNEGISEKGKRLNIMTRRPPPNPNKGSQGGESESGSG